MIAIRWHLEIFNGRDRIKENPMISDAAAEKLKYSRTLLFGQSFPVLIGIRNKNYVIATWHPIACA